MITINNDIIVRFITDTCTDEELEALSQWMRQSDENAAEVMRMERIYREAQAHAMSRREVEGALSRLHHRLHATDTTCIDEAESQQPTRRVNLTVLHRWAAAAAIVLVVMGTAFYFLNPFVGSSATEYLFAEATSNVPTQLTLADGTKVWLNSGSKLRYPKTFTDTLRKVRLEGEGYFEVTKDPIKPFVVDGKEMNVRVLGTKFNFSTAKSNRAAEVSLIEGKVRVTSSKNEGSVVLTPGQKARLVKNGQLSVSNANTRIDAVWHDGLIPFDGSNIKQIADALQQLYGVPFVIDSSVDLNRTYTGEIQWDESLGMVLTRLRNTIPVNFKRYEGKVYVYDR